MMKKKSGILTLGIAAAVAFGAGPLQAQRGGGFGGRAAGPWAGRSLDVVIENQETLELSQDQLGQVQELKTVMDADVLPLAEEIKVLRDQIRAGDVDREEGYREMQALRGELMTASAPLRGRLQEILTVEQHRKLQQIIRQDRPGRGRGGAFQGRRGGRMPRGQMRGGRGGVGTRQGFNGQGRGPASGFRRPLGDGSIGPRGPRSFGIGGDPGMVPPTV